MTLAAVGLVVAYVVGFAVGYAFRAYVGREHARLLHDQEDVQ